MNIINIEERPWGYFWCIDGAMLENFITEFFPRLSLNINACSAKILFINSHSKLSWQYHNRRKELWSVILGPVGIIHSPTDEQSELIIAQNKDFFIIDEKERHRLIGLDCQAIVAEIWIHTDENNLSDENDIVRLSDDYQR